MGATILALPLYRSHSIRFVEQESVWREEEKKNLIAMKGMLEIQSYAAI